MLRLPEHELHIEMQRTQNSGKSFRTEGNCQGADTTWPGIHIAVTASQKFGPKVNTHTDNGSEQRFQKQTHPDVHNQLLLSKGSKVTDSVVPGTFTAYRCEPNEPY